jgi:hypothetical protein
MVRSFRRGCLARLGCFLREPARHIVIAQWIMVAERSWSVSKSRISRRCRTSQPKVRSTAHLRGRGEALLTGFFADNLESDALAGGVLQKPVLIAAVDPAGGHGRMAGGDVVGEP